MHHLTAYYWVVLTYIGPPSKRGGLMKWGKTKDDININTFFGCNRQQATKYVTVEELEVSSPSDLAS